MTPRVLTIMGSGETAPTMVSTHRSLVARLGQPVNATVIDTPYGFQENASELAEKAVTFFRQSVNIEITVAGLLRMKGDSVDPVSVERGLRHVADADYVFAGPGSPTYALRQWSGSPLHDLLVQKVRTGGIVTFASAAALTLGSHTVPVYEIYKVGAEPTWETGLNLLGEIGIRAALIPHFDNAEGGHHDTRFCYLGERRLAYLESLLPEDHFVLGIDEHTALVLDLDADTATVTGRGGVTVRVRGSSERHSSGASFPLAELRNPAAGNRRLGAETFRPQGEFRASEGAESPAAGASKRSAEETAPNISDDHVRAFKVSMKDRDAEGAVRAALALEQDLGELEGPSAAAARAELRGMISALGDAAVGGVQDPRAVIGPYVEAILAVRKIVRAEKRYDLSDVIRDAFESLGVEVRDTPDGTVWDLRA